MKFLFCFFINVCCFIVIISWSLFKLLLVVYSYIDSKSLINKVERYSLMLNMMWLIMLCNWVLLGLGVFDVVIFVFIFGCNIKNGVMIVVILVVIVGFSVGLNN